MKRAIPGELTLDQAQAIVKVVQAKAVDINVPMNIAMVDFGGNLKAFCRMNDAFICCTSAGQHFVAPKGN